MEQKLNQIQASPSFMESASIKSPTELLQSITWRQVKAREYQQRNDGPQIIKISGELQVLQQRKTVLDRLAAKVDAKDIKGSLEHREAVLKSLGFSDADQSKRKAIDVEISVLKEAEATVEFRNHINAKNPTEIDLSIRKRKLELRQQNSSQLQIELKLLRTRKEEFQRLSSKTNAKEIIGSIAHREAIVSKLGDSVQDQAEKRKMLIEIKLLKESSSSFEKEGVAINILENRNSFEFYSPKARKDRKIPFSLENNNPLAKFSDNEEIPRYLNSHSQEYRQLLSNLLEKTGLSFDEDTEGFVALPAYKEGRNIQTTLENYARQSAKKKVAILVFDNHPLGTKSDKTGEVVQQFIKNHPEMKLGFVKAQFGEAARNIGNIRKIPNDMMLELAERRRQQNPQKEYPPLIMISNDADTGAEPGKFALKEDYFETIINFFRKPENQLIDGIAGKIDFPQDVMAKIPLMTVGRRLWQYLDIVKRSQVWKKPHLVGRNSAFRASTYCAFGGYNALRTCGEDSQIGHSIANLRKGVEPTTTHLNTASLITDPRRDLMAVVNKKPIAYQYADFKGSNQLRDIPTPELIKLAEDTVPTKDRINSEIMGVFYAFGRRTGYDPIAFQKAVGLLGVKANVHQEENGRWKCEILDTSTLEKGLKEKLFRDLLNRPLEMTLGDEIKTFEPIMEGETNHVYKISTKSGEQLVVRAAKNAEGRYKTEQAVFKRLRIETEVKTPDVKAIITPNETIPYTIEVLEYVKEARSMHQSLESADDLGKAVLLKDQGRILRQAHQLKTQGYGKLGSDGKTSDESSSWSKVIIKNDIKGLERRLHEQHRSFDPEVFQKADALLQSNRAYFDQITDPRLILSDFSNGNVLHNQNERTSTLIDIESPKSGDPMYDLAYYSFHNAHKYNLSSFYEGYGLSRDQYTSQNFQKIISLYQIRISLDALWYATWKNDSTKVEHAMNQLGRAVKYLS